LIFAAGMGVSLGQAFPESALCRLIAHHQSHVAWVGCSLHDLIMPSFSFLVGTALTFSVASRLARGQDMKTLTSHAVNRAVMLILLGVFLFSLNRVPFVFVHIFTAIGLAYLPVFFLSFRSDRTLWITFGIILAAYWAAFALYPLPGPDFDYSTSNVTQEWLQTNGLHGFAAHWQKNINFGWALDRVFLNRLPREHEYTGMGDGLTTINFIPLIATMILGVFAGRIIQGGQLPSKKVRWFVVAGVIGLASGWALGALGICPLVKSLWTPSWVLFSGGWCFLFLAVFYVMGEIWQAKRLLFPFVVLGMNSLAVYALANLQGQLAPNIFRRLAGSAPFLVLGPLYEPLLYAAFRLIVFWLFFYLLYRLRIFIRV
jgi:heparan-alpha-glucosaminide N-acetyltransferase